ncbi:hypothetical protein SAMN05660657_03732 [Geodermatophilus amargosae]|uniref:Uncharacterized protein n=1 Tax=Geodermatophilus amargosae TaxID=1296565 RepID=A0A1I7BPB1_9ACTN|nr:hypothetical protein SAMN05660657_03732 [Geodermatophilus amargosae]
MSAPIRLYVSMSLDSMSLDSMSLDSMSLDSTATSPDPTTGPGRCTARSWRPGP